MLKIRKYISSTQIFAIGFIACIGIGTLLLSLSQSQNTPISLLDCFFTATSATCVTGLSTISVTQDLSVIGQIIILALIQIGGIGIMGYAALFSIILNKKNYSHTSEQLQSIMDITDIRKLRTLIKNLFLYTFLFELSGAVILFLYTDYKTINTSHKIFHSIFHSVSAFCNAGFSLLPSSFENINSSIYLLTICTLIVLGGIGFYVIFDIHKKTNILKPKETFRKFNLHTKITLITTFLLITTGFLLFYLNEPLLTAMGNKERIIQSLFLSITSRTAGFNTVPIASLSISSIFLLTFFMVIGASPGSTGGGIKTTTFALIILKLKQIIRGRNDVEAFNRKISNELVQRALAVTAIFTTFVFIAVYFFTIMNNHPFIDSYFEIISSLGTVGLSTGITSSLSNAEKIILCILMFIGRIGPLTLALSLSLGHKRVFYSLPEGKVLVG